MRLRERGLIGSGVVAESVAQIAEADVDELVVKLAVEVE